MRRGRATGAEASGELWTGVSFIGNVRGKLLGVAALEVDAHYRAAIEHEPEFADHFLDFVHFIYRNDESRLKEAREILSKAHASMEDNGERAKLERGTREFEEFASHRAHDNSEL